MHPLLREAGEGGGQAAFPVHGCLYASSGTTSRSAVPCQTLVLAPPAAGSPIMNCACNTSRANASRDGGTTSRLGIMPRGRPSALPMDIIAARAAA